MIVGTIHHPGTNKGIPFVEHLVFEPGAGLCDRLGDLPAWPFLVVDQPAQHALELAEAQRFSFTQQQRQLRRQVLASFNDAEQRLGEIVEVEVRLAGVEITGIDGADQLTLVDACDLLAIGSMAEIVVDARRLAPKQAGINALLVDQPVRRESRIRGTGNLGSAARPR